MEVTSSSRLYDCEGKIAWKILNVLSQDLGISMSISDAKCKGEDSATATGAGFFFSGFDSEVL